MSTEIDWKTKTTKKGKLVTQKEGEEEEVDGKGLGQSRKRKCMHMAYLGESRREGERGEAVILTLDK